MVQKHDSRTAMFSQLCLNLISRLTGLPHFIQYKLNIIAYDQTHRGVVKILGVSDIKCKVIIKNKHLLGK